MNNCPVCSSNAGWCEFCPTHGVGDEDQEWQAWREDVEHKIREVEEIRRQLRIAESNQHRDSGDETDHESRGVSGGVGEKDVGKPPPMKYYYLNVTYRFMSELSRKRAQHTIHLDAEARDFDIVTTSMEEI
jgi:hypothetical protein